ncbi:MAG TPA: hypothetical protein PKM73_19655 [Verrucomicrobiota bacterium]|nr:hypothetical protein [Verrucomicrobiota bacterium]HNU52239.1 hypothetical protein [Verrucomicrobiota bacterium]
MKRFRTKTILIGGLLGLVCTLVLWRPIAVQYHKVAMRSWHSQQHWEAWSSHQQALIALGHFEPRDFPLARRTLTINSDLMRFVDLAPFRDGQWAVTPRSNRVSVIAYRGDMALWEEIVARFDRAEPDGAADRSQPIRAETNRTSVAAGSDR